MRIKITDDGLSPAAPGHEGDVRQASLSGVANRYIDLQLPAAATSTKIADGGVIDQSDTTTAVDLDQLFNTFDPKTRKALSGVIRGYAASYGGQGRGGQRRLGLPQPVAGGLQPPVRGAQPRHARCSSASSTRVLEARHRPRRRAATTSPASSTTSPPRPARSAARSRRCRPRSASCPASCAAPTRPSSTCAPRWTTSIRSSRSPSPWPRSCGPFLAELRPLARDARPTLRDLAGARPLAGRRQRPDRARRSPSVPLRNIAVGPTQAQRQGARGRLPGARSRR